jgi:prepilin-type processing-associated H-X9-DG protein
MRGTGNQITWFGGWSVHGRILPFLEQGAMFNSINFNTDFEEFANTTITGVTLSVFLCPSEANQQPKVDNAIFYGGTNYGFNMGDWYVWGGFSSQDNRGAFVPNRSRGWADFTDGLSNTLLAAEVKTYQDHLRDCGGLAKINNPNVIPDPSANPLAVAPEYAGDSSCKHKGSGHTEWADGDVYQSGMTTAWTPNKKILGGPDRTSDLDLIGQREKEGGPTFAAVNARSRHPGGISTLFGDGSVRFIKDTINGQSWRALGTIHGGEALSADSY